MRGIAGFVWFADSKTRGAADWCRRQIVKENLSPHFEVLGIFEGVPCIHKCPPGLSSMGVGSNWTIFKSSTRSAVSASRESRLRRSPLHCIQK